MAQAPAQPAQPGGANQAQWGKIMKVDGNKVMFQQYDPKTKTFAKERELTVTPDNLKVFQMGLDNKQAPLTGGLKADPFTNIGKEGAFVRVGMTGNSVGQIYLYGNQGAFEKGIQSFPGTGSSTNPGGGSGK